MEKNSSMNTQRRRQLSKRPWLAGLFASLPLGAMMAATVVLASCVDPVREAALAKLGPEKGNVPTGPLHRPGQPCVLCHSEEGDASPFTLAGTVYLEARSDVPVDNVQVTAIDAKGKSFTSTTNCAGNFFIRPDEFTPTYPVWLEMQGGMVFRSMESATFREGSCATCHFDPVGPASAGHIYLLEDPSVEQPPPNRCR
jgi:hypothetical protein